MASLDFTERRATERPRRESEERLRLAAEAAQFGIYDGDLVTGSLYWSPQLLVILGLPADTVIPAPGDVPAFAHPDEVERVRQVFRQALDPAGDGTVMCEHRILRPDGAVRWVQIKGQIQFAGEGAQRRATRSSGIVLDITARKEAEEQLAAEHDAMARLQQIGTLFIREGNLEPVLGQIVEGAIAIAGADFGKIQLLDPAAGGLRIVAHRGLPPWWVEYWNAAGTGMGCYGPAWRRGERVIVEDVERSPFFAGTPALEIQLRAGIRAVQSTPLVSRSGTPLGTISTHYKRPHRPDERVLRRLDLLARQAADIIERAHSEDALRESESRLRAIMDNSPDPIFLKDSKGQMLLANPATLAVLGRSAEAVIGKTSDHYHDDPGLARAIIANDARILATGTPEVVEETILAPEGPLTFLSTKVPYRDAGGQIIGLIGIARDITDRKRIEEAVDAHRQLLETVVNTIPAAVSLIGSDLRLRLINPAYQAIAPGKEMLGKTLDEIWPESGLDLSRICRRVLETGEPHQVVDESYQLRRHPDGPLEEGYFSWSLHRVRLPGDEGWGLVNAASEATARKEAEKQLRESELFYRQTLDSIPGMVFTTLADGWCDFQSQQWVDYTGVPVSEHLGEGWKRLLHPDDRPLATAAWRAALAGHALYDLEYRVRRRDGVYEWFRVIARPIRDTSGQIVRWFGVALNVHELKEAEEELREADRRKDEFLATLAHELRNPLAPISNAAAILQIIGTQTPAAQAARDMIARQVQHMTRLIDDLLDVSRITRGKLQLRRERVDLLRIAQQAVEDARPCIEKRGHELLVSLSLQPMWVDGDPVRLAQIFSNLLNNACTYTPEQGRVSFEVEQHGADAIVKVEDSGIGIAPEQLPHIFDMFHQVSSPEGQTKSGLGIGLSLVRALVEMHGGHVEARSEGAGKGSVFVARLPVLVGAGTTAPTRAADTIAREPATGRVLLVDDNDNIVTTLTEFLRMNSIEVEVARDGLEAVQAAEHFKPDLVLLDLGMPNLDGLSACRRMRQASWGKDLTIVAMTGWGQDSDRRKTKDAGFDGHLVKPVAPAEILNLLASSRSRSKA